MATIKIGNLNPVGSELFGDSESYLNELTDGELNMTNGGSTTACMLISFSVALHTRERGWW
jgi:hypothetical protein